MMVAACTSQTLATSPTTKLWNNPRTDILHFCYYNWITAWWRTTSNLKRAKLTSSVCYK
jgi:hypothetical protein